MAAEPSALQDPGAMVYLDLWVWIRLASAAVGKAREPSDYQVLAAVRDASVAGIAFPLSSTHYMELARIADPRQRHDVARTMVEISCFQTLRSRRTLLRHQFLNAMHESFGRPAFRPRRPEVLGTGAAWALTGKQGDGQILNTAEGLPVTAGILPGGVDTLRRMNQVAEFMMLAGPQDTDIPKLRAMGYRPEEVELATESRVNWEELYTELLTADPISRSELRVRIQAREVIHEHYELLQELLAEYHVDLYRAIGHDPEQPGSGRPGMVAFADRIPSLRIAVDLKVELFRASKPWTSNSIYDIDALSMAAPYSHAIVPDSEMADLLSRSKTQQRTGTKIVHKLRQLPDVLSQLAHRTEQLRVKGSSGSLLARPNESICFTIADLLAMSATGRSGT